MNHEKKRLIFGVSGASGMPLARFALKLLSTLPDIEVHLIVSPGAQTAMTAECGENALELEKFAHAGHAAGNLAAPPASGSWRHCGMIVCPCSMSSLAAIACGMGTNLLHRAADVTLKERRPLLLVARETPLNLVHLRNMVAATEAGAVIMPFIPAFYTGESSMEAAMRQFTGRLLDQLRIPHQLCRRWGENEE